MNRTCLVGLLLWSILALYLQSSNAQGTSWEEYMKTGSKASYEGRYSDAEKAFSLAVADAKKSGAESLNLAASLDSLATVYDKQAKYTEAELLYKQALQIREKNLDANDRLIANSLNNLAEVYRAQGKYKEAEPLFIRSLKMSAKDVRNAPDTSTCAYNLAVLYTNEERYADAEAVAQEALMIRKKIFPPDHPLIAQSLGHLAALSEKQGKYDEAETLYKQAIAIDEKSLGSNHPNFATALSNLGALYCIEKKFAEAEPLFKQSLAIYQKTLGPDHPKTKNCSKIYVAILRKMNLNAETQKAETEESGL